MIAHTFYKPQNVNRCDDFEVRLPPCIGSITKNFVY